MATECNIVYVDSTSGKANGIYVTRCGFPGYTGSVLLNKYNNEDKVRSLIELGNLYQVGYSTDPVAEEIKAKGFDYICHSNNHCVSLVRDRDYDSLSIKEIEDINHEKLSTNNYLDAIDKLNKNPSQYSYMWKDGKWYFRKWRSRFEEMTEIRISHDEEEDG